MAKVCFDLDEQMVYGVSGHWYGGGGEVELTDADLEEFKKVNDAFWDWQEKIRLLLPKEPDDRLHS